MVRTIVNELRLPLRPPPCYVTGKQLEPEVIGTKGSLEGSPVVGGNILENLNTSAAVADTSVTQFVRADLYSSLGDVCQHQEIHTTPESVIPGATAFSTCRKYGAAMCAGLSVEPVCQWSYTLDTPHTQLVIKHRKPKLVTALVYFQGHCTTSSSPGKF